MSEEIIAKTVDVLNFTVPDTCRLLSNCGLIEISAIHTEDPDDNQITDCIFAVRCQVEDVCGINLEEFDVLRNSAGRQAIKELGQEGNATILDL